MTVILVTHDLPSLAGRANRIGILSGGSLHHGSADEMLTTEKLSEVYGCPVHVTRQDGNCHIHAKHAPLEQRP